MRSHQVLHIDDDPEIQTIVGLSLGLDPGMSVLSAGSEEQAILALNDHPHFRPTILLLDYWIGRVTGIEIGERLRAMPCMEAVTTIFLTGKREKHDMDEMIAAGAAAVLAKPFDPLLIAKQLRALSGG